jgi:S1-C subfamily serine protease
MAEKTPNSSVATLIAIVVLLGALIGGAVLLFGPTPATVQDVSFIRSDSDANLSAAKRADPVLDVAAAIPAADDVAEPEEEQTSETDPSEARALEDVIGGVADAVVLVETPSGRGTAFFVSQDTLLTNVHVVGNNGTVTIQRSNGAREYARVAQSAPAFDVAVLKVTNSNPNHAIIPLGSSRSARVGQEVIAIGSALGTLQNTVTRGIVSAMRQAGNATLVQTDAAVNPGNSGGPLLNREGVAIGITTMGYRNSQGLNFAVAIDHARALIDGTASQVSTATAAADPLGLSPAVPSEADRARSDAEKAYEQSLVNLGRRAEALDEYWARFRAQCYDTGRISGTYDREWMATLTSSGMLDPVRAGCGDWLADIQRQGNTVRTGVLSADEAARRAGLYPGARRDALQKHRLQVQ